MQWASVVSWEAFHNCVSKNCLETNHRNFYKDPDVISFSIIILVYTTFMQVLVFTWKYSQLLREKYSTRLRLSQKYPASFGFCAIEIPTFYKKSTYQSSCVWHNLNWTSLYMWVWSSRLHYSCRNLQGYQILHLPYTTSYLSLNKGYSLETFSFRHLWKEKSVSLPSNRTSQKHRFSCRPGLSSTCGIIIVHRCKF